MPEAAITQVGEHAYVVPRAALPLLAAHRLDLELFDVAALIDQQYDDEHRSTLPVIVDYGAGADAAAESNAARLQHARKTVTLASLGAAAFAAEKRHARAFWRSLTAAPNGSGASTALAGGATRVDLDGRVRARWTISVAQIHAPEAWAAGFDGTGFDRGRARHGLRPVPPRPRHAVSESTNFTTDATRGRRQRPRHPRRLDDRRHRRRIRRHLPGCRAGREADGRQGAGRRGLRRGLVGPGGHAVGRRPRRRRRQHEPRRRTRATGPIRSAARSTSSRRPATPSSSSRPATTAASR